MGDRWLHVQAVGRSAEELRVRGFDVSEAVVMTAWLHDVGYADTVANTGFHPLDGAEWLRQQAAPEGVVALVAYHSVAQYEAEARGLAEALAGFPARAWKALRTRRTCASLLVALDVHPRVAMTILRHSKIAVTMDIYSQVSSTATKEALKRLGNQFGEEVL
jgi:hypothetical protein